MASFITAVKSALEKKHAAQHPDAKPTKGSKSVKLLRRCAAEQFNEASNQKAKDAIICDVSSE